MSAALSALSSLYTDIVTNGIIGIKGMSIDQLLLPIDSQNDQSDLILLKLSVIRQLYTLPVQQEEERACTELLTVTNQLVELLKNPEQLIVYEAEKACLAVLSSSACTIKILQETLISLMQQVLREDNHVTEYEAVYSLQLLTEVMKTLRKASTAISKRECCLFIILSYWNHLFKKIITSSTSSPTSHQYDMHSMANTINQRLLQLLLLEIEILRHSDIHTSMLQSLLSPVILEEMCASVQCSGSIICHTKLCDFFKKCLPLADEKERGLVFIILDLFIRSFFSSQYIFVAVEDWAKRQSSSEKSSASLEDSIIDTFIRKSLITSLQLATLYKPDSMKSELLFRPALRMVEYLRDVSVRNGVEDSNDTILQLISEQDNCLVETLSFSLKLTGLQLQEGTDLLLNVHELFLSFLSSISYDESTLIDFIIDTDTSFDLFFNDYLKYTNKEPESLPLHCQKLDHIKVKITEDCAPQLQLVDYSESESEDEEDFIESTEYRVKQMFGRLKDKLMKLVKHSIVSPNKLPNIKQIVENIVFINF